MERFAYSAYGTPTITDASGTARTTMAIGNRYTYTGREWDETLTLFHFRARKFDSASGGLAGRDPLGCVDSECLYQIGFCLFRTDPYGEKTQTGDDDSKITHKTNVQKRTTTSTQGLAQDAIIQKIERITQNGIRTPKSGKAALPQVLLGKYLFVNAKRSQYSTMTIASTMRDWTRKRAIKPREQND